MNNEFYTFQKKSIMKAISLINELPFMETETTEFTMADAILKMIDAATLMGYHYSLNELAYTISMSDLPEILYQYIKWIITTKNYHGTMYDFEKYCNLFDFHINEKSDTEIKNKISKPEYLYVIVQHLDTGKIDTMELKINEKRNYSTTQSIEEYIVSNQQISQMTIPSAVIGMNNKINNVTYIYITNDSDKYNKFIFEWYLTH